MKNIIELKNGIKLGYSSDLEKWRADTFFTKEPETIAWIDSFEKKDNLKKLNYQNTWVNVNQKILESLNEN